MQYAINKNPQGKGNKNLETFQVVRRAVAMYQSRTPTAQEVQDQTQLSWLFLVQPEAREKLSQLSLSSKILRMRESPFLSQEPPLWAQEGGDEVRQRGPK